MKQIYPMTVLVLMAIAVCCSIIGVRPAAIVPVAKSTVQASSSHSPRLAGAQVVANGE